MSTMIDMQQRVVADRIARLSEEAAAVRMARALGGRVGRKERPGNGRDRDMPSERLGGRSPLRVRVGSWLVSLGVLIAGPASPARSHHPRGN